MNNKPTHAHIPHAFFCLHAGAIVCRKYSYQIDSHNTHIHAFSQMRCSQSLCLYFTYTKCVQVSSSADFSSYRRIELKCLICPSRLEFMTTGVPSSSYYLSGERVELMSHRGREERRGGGGRERALGGRRRASFRNNFDPSVKQFCSNFLPLIQKHVGEKKDR